MEKLQKLNHKKAAANGKYLWHFACECVRRNAKRNIEFIYFKLLYYAIYNDDVGLP